VRPAAAPAAGSSAPGPPSPALRLRRHRSCSRCSQCGIGPPVPRRRARGGVLLLAGVPGRRFGHTGQLGGPDSFATQRHHADARARAAAWCGLERRTGFPGSTPTGCAGVTQASGPGRTEPAETSRCRSASASNRSPPPAGLSDDQHTSTSPRPGRQVGSTRAPIGRPRRRHVHRHLLDRANGVVPRGTPPAFGSHLPRRAAGPAAARHPRQASRSTYDAVILRPGRRRSTRPIHGALGADASIGDAPADDDRAVSGVVDMHDHSGGARARAGGER
jgi:hypothetical protein